MCLGFLYFSDKAAFLKKIFLTDNVPNNPLIADPYEVQLATLPEFGSCTSLLRQSKYTDSVRECLAALARVRDPIDQLYIKYPLALAYAGLLTPEDGRRSIDLLKEIIAYPEGPKTLKAQSVRELDGMLNSQYRQQIKSLLVNTEPYAAMQRAAGDDEFEFSTKLLEFGSELQPLAQIEYRLASLYAWKLYELSKNSDPVFPGSPKASRMSDLRLAIREKIANGDTDFERIKSLQEFEYLVPAALLAKAIAANYYQQATGEIPVGNPELIFQETLAASEKYEPTLIPLVSYRYATYLAENGGQERAVDIRRLLDAVIRNPAINLNSHYVGWIMRQGKNRPATKKQLVLLAKIDTRFQEALLSIGWIKADFE